MRTLQRVAVFCGSNVGRGEAYTRGAAALGEALAESGIGLVYGGTHRGLMGAVADAALAGGGTAHGVITESLAGRGHAHEGLTHREVVPDLRARKSRMLALADACIALPGGIGTFEEFMEVWSGNQLGELDLPAGLYDIQGFFQPFMAFIDRMIEEAFLPPAHRDAVVVNGDPRALIRALEHFEAPTVSKWL